MALIYFVLIAILVIWLYIKNEEKKRVNLPGPKCLPILGSLLELDKRMHLLTFKWIRQHGKSIYFKIIQQHFVTIGDVKLARRLFSLDQMAGRPPFDLFLLYEGEYFGIVSSQGDLWEAHRRFTLRQLRDFGFGKNTMEMLIMDEVQDLTSLLKSKNGSSVSGIKELFSLAVVNSLWTVVSGQRYAQDDPKLRTISNSLNIALTEAANSGGIIFFLPWLKYFAPDKTGYRATRTAFEQLREFVHEALHDHKRTYQSGTCRDFIDVYLKEMEGVTDPKSTFYGSAGEKQLMAVIGDLFFAGTDTTSTTLAWAILYLASHVNVQEKLHTEISSVCGDSRKISLSDRPNMPYLLATIDEVLRLSSILPNGVGHTPMSDIDFEGMHIPKGTIVTANMYYIHRNPETWGDPDNFKPERFLHEDEKVYKKSENVIAFSFGRRQCLGETLARDTIFLFIANLFQTFKVIVNPNEPPPPLEPAIGISLNPQPYSVVFKLRHEQ